MLLSMHENYGVDYQEAFAKGYTQKYGVDYQETFAPVAKRNTVCILISVAVNRYWPLRCFSLKNAFLNGYLEDEVFMEI